LSKNVLIGLYVAMITITTTMVFSMELI